MTKTKVKGWDTINALHKGKTIISDHFSLAEKDCMWRVVE